jgi:hypothetical protein
MTGEFDCRAKPAFSLGFDEKNHASRIEGNRFED